MLTITEFKSVFLRSLLVLLKRERFDVVRKGDRFVFYSQENEGTRAILELEYSIDGIGNAYAMYRQGASIVAVIHAAKEEIYNRIISVFKYNE